MKPIFALVVAPILFLATQASAQSPVMHWGNDTRAMSEADCLNRARFAVGEVGLKNCGEGARSVLGCGDRVAVLTTCVQMGARTFIHVVGASPESRAAEEGRNRVRSIVMGPPN